MKLIYETILRNDQLEYMNRICKTITIQLFVKIFYFVFLFLLFQWASGINNEKMRSFTYSSVSSTAMEKLCGCYYRTTIKI